MNEVNTVRSFDSLHHRPLHLFEGSDTELTSRCISVFRKATLVRQYIKKACEFTWFYFKGFRNSLLIYSSELNKDQNNLYLKLHLA